MRKVFTIQKIGLHWVGTWRTTPEKLGEDFKTLTLGAPSLGAISAGALMLSPSSVSWWMPDDTEETLKKIEGEVLALGFPVSRKMEQTS